MFLVCNSYVETIGWCQTYLKSFNYWTIEDIMEMEHYKSTDKEYKKVLSWQEENPLTCFTGYACKL